MKASVADDRLVIISFQSAANALMMDIGKSVFDRKEHTILK